MISPSAMSYLVTGPILPSCLCAFAETISDEKSLSHAAIDTSVDACPWELRCWIERDEP